MLTLQSALLPPRSAVEGTAAQPAFASIPLDADQTRQFKAVCKAHGATVTEVLGALLAVAHVKLARRYGRDDWASVERFRMILPCDGRRWLAGEDRARYVFGFADDFIDVALGAAIAGADRPNAFWAELVPALRTSIKPTRMDPSRFALSPEVAAEELRATRRGERVGGYLSSCLSSVGVLDRFLPARIGSLLVSDALVSLVARNCGPLFIAWTHAGALSIHVNGQVRRRLLDPTDRAQPARHPDGYFDGLVAAVEHELLGLLK